MASLSWGGYSNGKIPLTALKKVSNFVPLAGEPVGAGGALLMTEAAHQWEIMCIDALSATGESPTASECYRDLPSQKGRYTTYREVGKPLSAYPGTSNHGWGRSLDIGMAARTWITANGGMYGFYATVAGEPWHFDYLGNPKFITAQSSTAETLKEEQEMTTRLYRDSSTGTIAAVDPTVGYYWALPNTNYMGLLAHMQIVPNATPIELDKEQWKFLMGQVDAQRTNIASKVPAAVWGYAMEASNGNQTAQNRLVGADLKAGTAPAGGVSAEDLAAAIKKAGISLNLDTKQLVKDILDAQSERLKE